MNAIEIVASVFILSGVIVAAVAAVGLVRFPDVLSRMHAASKPQTFGLILLMVGAALASRSWAITGMLVVVVGSQLLTITAASAMLGRAAFRRGFVHGGQYAIDELTPRLAMGTHTDDDDDGFIDTDPRAGVDGGLDLSEPMPSNVVASDMGLELASLKEYWDEEEADGAGFENSRPHTSEFRAFEGEKPGSGSH